MKMEKLNMPLSFESKSHGPITFGFFNIETDMLLMANLFFFAPEFCEAINSIAKQEGDTSFQTTLQTYAIQNKESIGDLMGAIHKVRYSGFIGEVYTKFPFPDNMKGFKQKPHGANNRDQLKILIGKYAEPQEIMIIVDTKKQEVCIGEYEFSHNDFKELVQYVWEGGYPQWENQVRPDYVSAMMAEVEKSKHPLL